MIMLGFSEPSTKAQRSSAGQNVGLNKSLDKKPTTPMVESSSLMKQDSQTHKIKSLKVMF